MTNPLSVATMHRRKDHSGSPWVSLMERTGRLSLTHSCQTWGESSPQNMSISMTKTLWPLLEGSWKSTINKNYPEMSLLPDVVKIFLSPKDVAEKLILIKRKTCNSKKNGIVVLIILGLFWPIPWFKLTILHIQQMLELFKVKDATS